MNASSRLGALLSIGAIGVSLAGCGSSGGLSRSNLVARANAICAATQTAARAVPAPPSFQDLAAAAGYFDKIAPITDKETHDLSALKPDGSVAHDWNAFIAAQTAANTLLQTLKAKADANDATGLQDLAKVTTVGDQVLAAAGKLGAGSCAR